MTNTRSRGSSSFGPPISLSGRAGSSFIAEMKCICDDMVVKASNQSVTEIEVLGYEIESLRESMILLITSID